MTTEQEKTAEAILTLHKNNGGTVVSDELSTKIKYHRLMDKEIILSRLIEMELIKYMDVHRYRTRISEKGEDFPGFEAYKKKKADDHEKQELIQDYTLNQLKWAKRKAKYWWLSVGISWLIGFFIGNFELIISWVSNLMTST